MTVSVQDFCAAIYCTTLSAPSFAVSEAGRIGVVAHAHDAETDYHVVFERVSDFSWQDEKGAPVVASPQDLLEFSVVEITGRPGAWNVWINPWYSTEITFRCEQIRINDAEVVGSGRWLQDGLPTHQPDIPPPRQ